MMTPILKTNGWLKSHTSPDFTWYSFWNKLDRFFENKELMFDLLTIVCILVFVGLIAFFVHLSDKETEEDEEISLRNSEHYGKENK
jgi:hypothetical protein